MHTYISHCTSCLGHALRHLFVHCLRGHIACLFVTTCLLVYVVLERCLCPRREKVDKYLVVMTRLGPSGSILLSL